MNVQVEFIEPELSMISVPILKAPLITQGLIRLCLKAWKSKNLSSSQVLELDNFRTTGAEDDSDSDEDEDDFFNITFTPYECSIICNTEHINTLFEGILPYIPEAKVNPSTYMGIKIDCDGSDRSTNRILELSGPISEDGIPIFFLSTYFSDYMLIPYTSKSQVNTILYRKGFLFSTLENSYVGVGEDSSKPKAGTKVPDYLFSLITVPENAPELVSTGTRTSYDADAIELAMVRTIISIPEYFSVTMHSSETSFVIDKSMIGTWPKNSLLGALEEPLSPILLDLREIPLDTVGVVASISRMLADQDIDMSYLSTLFSSIVLINKGSIEKAKKGFQGP